MTHKKQADRRKAMAKYAKTGKTAMEVARRFRVSTMTAENACIQYGVVTSRGPKHNCIKENTMKILCALLSGASQTKASKDFNCSKQFINQIVKRAKDAGFKFNKKS